MALVTELLFDVFGRRIAVRGEPGNWSAYELGNEGKRRPADFVVPHELQPDQLLRYLADLFHESAAPFNGDVRLLATHRYD